MSDDESKVPGPDQAADSEPADEAAEKAEAEAKVKAEALAKAKAAKAAVEAAKPVWERNPEIPEWVEAADDPVAAAIREAHGDSLLSARTLADDLVLVVAAEAVRDVARSLHDEHGFTLLIDICGADYPEREDAPRFEVIYHLMNIDSRRRVRIRLSTDEETPVPSLVPIWRGANWAEREVFDMYGVRFADHPDMTRILMWEGFSGYPLRKDFPLEGIETGAAIYPEYYEESAGPVAGTGTGWKPPKEEEPAADGDGEQDQP